MKPGASKTSTDYQKKRAARKFFAEDSPHYHGAPQAVHEYFIETFGPRECNTTTLDEALKHFVPTAETDPNLYTPPTLEEIQRQLCALANSAPGKDPMEY